MKMKKTIIGPSYHSSLPKIHLTEAYLEEKEKPICENCGQYQTKFKGHYDCFNDCVKRGFALEPEGGKNDK